MHFLATDITVKETSMSPWLFVGALVLALLIGYGLGFAMSGGRRPDGKPWWYDVAFPKPDEATMSGLQVLADRYALGEIDADEYQSRAKALQESADGRSPYMDKGKPKKR